MRDAPVPIIAYVMVGLTSAVLAYVTYYDNSVNEEEKNQENTESKSNITPVVAGILPTAAMLPAFLTGKKEEPPLTEENVEEEINEPKNEQNNENREQDQQQPVDNEIKQTGGKKSKKNKTKNHKQLYKNNKNNKTKHRK